MENSKYKLVLDFLDRNAGEKYRKLEKCKNELEREYMIKVSEEGKVARDAFTDLVRLIEQRAGLRAGKITQWQNSGSIVSYFWCQMKKEKAIDSNISLSLFAEKSAEVVRYRVSVELAVTKATQDEIVQYRRMLDIPLDDGLVYVSGGNNEDEFTILPEKDNNVVKSMNLKKVQVSYLLAKDGIDEVDVEQSILLGAKKLAHYYDVAIGEIEAAQDEGDIEVVLPEKEEKGCDEQVPEESIKTPISPKEALSQIKSYIFARGFDYPAGLIENFYLCLKSKPFVILAGTSGTGKTRLAKLFAEAIGAKYKLIPVRPDWSDSSDLFGHLNLSSKFEATDLLMFLKEAQVDPNRPYILCLDEMNLARVEYYLSDFLSVIETRDRIDGCITSAPLICESQYGTDNENKEKYGEIRYPSNLYVIGTVNMDETTFPFSKKVLDRANTIEFNYVDLMPSFDAVAEVPEKLQLPNSFLRTEYLVLARDCAGEQEYVREICAELQSINEILLKANAHVGYRVRDEIVFYMLNNKAEGGLLKHEEAMDNEIMQKILPRIQGSSASVRDMLCALFKACAADQNQKTGDTDSEKMRKVLSDESITCRYRKSAEKLELMVRRFEEDGFTSYWQ